MDNGNGKRKSQVPIWQKSNLTIEEAAEVFRHWTQQAPTTLR